MKIVFNITLLLSILSISDVTLFAQTTGSKNVSFALPEISFVDIEPSGSLSLSLIAPNEAGNPIVAPAANKSKWLNYTSAIQTGGGTKHITASISSKIPGFDIKLSAAAASGSGGGTLGTSTGQITLSTTAQTIISGIGGAYTGDGTNNGHQLTISIVPIVSSYSLIKAQSNTQVQITYTISAN